MVARVMEADPVIDTHGRGSEDFYLGDVWKDLLRWSEEWTGYLFDSVASVRRKVFEDCYQIGESFEKVWWCPWEEGGVGMVVHEFVSGLEMLWPRESTSDQLRDAEYIMHPRPVEIEVLERKYPKLKDQMEPDYPSRFVAALEPAAFDQYTTYVDDDLDERSTPIGARNKKAYEVEIWEKAQVWKAQYFRKDNGRPAVMRRTDPETGAATEVPMTEERFGDLRDEQQDFYTSHRVPSFELSKGVMVNRFWAEPMSLHEYDESNGGHGGVSLRQI